MTKKSILIFMLTIVLFCACVIPLSRVTYIAHPSSLTVVIDAGHGGIDSGATGTTTGASESEINLSVALKLKEYFENAGFGVVMTRSTPMGLYGVMSEGFKRRDLEKRVEITKRANADIFISIHMNEYTSSSRCGAQVFYRADDESKTLAAKIQTELDKIDSDKRSNLSLSGDYYILNNSPIPSVICECGFLSNETDEARLVTEEYQSQLAYSIFLGSCAYFYQNAVSNYFSCG
jgi:N-acetylmuramoyl-L-alanine amidase